MTPRPGGETNSVVGSWINGPNIQIGSAGNVTLALGRPDYQVQWLLPSPRGRRVPKRQRTPSHLLDARRELVPFWPRPDVQYELMAWRDDTDDPASVLLVHGPGGQGKTRLANAFAGLCHETGWAVARAVSRVHSPGDVLPDGPQAVAGSAAMDEHKPVLVVVDYAERWPVSTLAELIRSLVLDFTGRTLRVLLLARSHGQVWQALSPLLGRDIDILDPVALGTMTATPHDRDDAFTQAAHAFQQALGQPQSPVTPPDLSHDDFGSVLMLHMAALAAVCADHDHQTRPTRTDLSGYLLEHEKRHWPLTGPTHDGVTPAQAADSVFVAAVFGPFPTAADATAVLASGGIAEQAMARTVLAWHDTLYPADTQHAAPGLSPALAPLRPDRFGEDFVAHHLTVASRAIELLHCVLDQAHTDAAWGEDAVRRSLIVLAAVADRHAPIRAILWNLLNDQRLATRVNATVIQTSIDHAPLTTCQAIEAALPNYRTDLLQAAATLTDHILTALPLTTTPATRARYLNNLGIRMAEAGDKQAALAPVREAVERNRELAEADPAAHLHNLAASLSNLGVRLAEAGDKQAALAPAREAVTIQRALAEADPAAHLPNLAASLNNLGNPLAEAGDKQAALAPAREAVTIRRALAEADPAAYLPDLAMSLWALAWGQTHDGPKSSALAEALDASEAACQLYKRLSEAWPDGFGDLLNAARATRDTVRRLLEGN